MNGNISFLLSLLHHLEPQNKINYHVSTKNRTSRRNPEAYT